jgi:hypothetical protein
MTTEQPATPPPVESTPPPVESTPQPAPTAQPPASDSGPAISPGQILAGLGAIALVVSAFLNWKDLNGATAKGTKVPAEFLVDKGASNGGASILVVLAIAAAVIGVGVLVAQLRVLAVLGAVLGLVVVVLYCVQVQRVLDDANTSIGLTDFVGIGTYIALAGGIGALVGSLVPRRS